MSERIRVWIRADQRRGGERLAQRQDGLWEVLETEGPYAGRKFWWREDELVERAWWHDGC